MKSYTINLPGKTRLRTLDELNELLELSVKEENYELCLVIKEAIDNYDKYKIIYANV